VVTLTGTVESQVERELAVELAQSVEGVTEVNDQLRVAADAPRATSPGGFAQTVENATITAKIKSQLLWNDQVSGLDIHVSTREGRVTLEGTVGSVAEAALAERIAFNTKGVKSVNNQLTVVEGNTSLGIVAQTKEAVRETAESVERTVRDTWITTKVKSLLAFDRRLDGIDIDGTTDAGVVTLTGAVQSGLQEQQLIEAMRNVTGVEHVRSELRVVQ
jgi:osmotically-inducible protein OsmY